MSGAIVIQRSEETLPAVVAREDWWPQLASEIRATAGPEAWEHWLKSMQPCAPFLQEDGTACLTVATAFLKSWIEKHYTEVIVSVCRTHGFMTERIQITSRSTRDQPIPKTEKPEPVCETAGPTPIAPNASIHFLPASPQEVPGENAVPIIYDDREPLNEMIELLPANFALMCQTMIDRHMSREGIYPARMAVLQWLAKQEQVQAKRFNALNVKVSRLPTARAIIDIISRDRRVSPDQICSEVRSRDLVLARHLSIAVIRHLTKLSLPLIGKIVGGRDHTTAMYACTQVAKKCDEDQEWRRMTLRHEFEIDRSAWLQGKPAFTNRAIEPDWEICTIPPSSDEVTAPQKAATEVQLSPEPITCPANDDIVDADSIPQVILGGKPARKRHHSPLQTNMFSLFDEQQPLHG